MTFGLDTILVFVVAALIYRAAVPGRWRGWFLMVGSAVAVYWLQPFLFVRWLDFILPTATLVLTAILWWFTRDRDAQRAPTRDDLLALAMLVAVIMGLALLRFVPDEYLLTASRPPDPLTVLLALVMVAVVVGAAGLLTRRFEQRPVLTGLLVLLVGLFVVLKTDVLATEVSRFFRAQAGQNTNLAAAVDIGWLGFSYVAFRLLHTVRDRQTSLLPALSLREYISYVIFAPAFTAGPIDRAERFVEDFRALPDQPGLDAGRIGEGFSRIAVGMFKKFVIADSLALGMALTPELAARADSPVGLWLLLYGYALRLFFDFSGYSDIAIGIGILFGIRLPENFDRPYLKTDITRFWQSWHMTLSNWARFYVFSPLSRALLTRKPRPSPTLIVLSTQLATMIVIGLWHGVTVNFFVWGVWHGLALFVHKQWSDRTRKWQRQLKDRPVQKRLWTGFAWFITFHYVVLGWVWFLLPDFDAALRVFGGLFGLKA